ncbi:hypothetical protein [Streptacidiphilus melanogenes]|uniref:hypothetical protein n=1 Tax=Streptacidiphilus melanogenes TaxID=411235 RepID=UPI0005A7A5F6|nr:hypothetical protein [Streptacidiphilus melanogenes]
MTRDELDALTARLRERPGGVPRAVEQALKAVDAYLSLTEGDPGRTGLECEHAMALELWHTVQEATVASTGHPPGTTVGAGTTEAA